MVIVFIIFSGGSIYYVSSNWEEIAGKSICVLGLPQTGKTLFLNALQGKFNQQSEQTTIDKIDSFVLKDNEGNIVLKVRNTKDISGGESYVKEYYKELIKNSDIIFFCCNMYDYIYNEESKKEVKGRLEFIYQLMKEYGKTDKNCLRLILTYADKLSDFSKTELVNKFMSMINDTKESCAGEIKMIAAVNMTNEDDVKQLIEKIVYG